MVFGGRLGKYILLAVLKSRGELSFVQFRRQRKLLGFLEIFYLKVFSFLFILMIFPLIFIMNMRN